MIAIKDGPVQIVEVGPRDGFQAIGPFIPTASKISFLARLVAAGLRRIEIGSFVSKTAVPQLADTPMLIAALEDYPMLDAQILVPNQRYAHTAVAAGARHLVFVLSVSEAHNRSNVRRDPLQSAADYEGVVAETPADLPIRLNIATAFDCPFGGRIPIEATLSLLDRLVPVKPDAEICLCDTTGRVTPDHVAELIRRAVDRFGTGIRWAFHAHDTYGLGLANVLAAYQNGIRIFDSSFAGLGGCPFAPGATGNVATEDVVWMFAQMGIETGIDLDALLPIAIDATYLPGAATGGRVREALRGRSAALCR